MERKLATGNLCDVCGEWNSNNDWIEAKKGNPESKPRLKKCDEESLGSWLRDK